MRLAIIPARGGSKRIPRKNIRPFCGQPIIAYPIRAALDSGCFDEVMVSTDDDEIASTAIKLGASVPFKRAPSTATDTATTADVLMEVLTQWSRLRGPVGIGCCIYPTAAFITEQLLRRGLEHLMADPLTPAVVPITRFSHPIQRAFRLDGNRVWMFRPEYASTRTQDLEPAYHDAGQFYWFRAASFLERRCLISPGTVGLVIPASDAQDIDTEDDWQLAEMKFRTARAHTGV